MNKKPLSMGQDYKNLYADLHDLNELNPKLFVTKSTVNQINSIYKHSWFSVYGL